MFGKGFLAIPTQMGEGLRSPGKRPKRWDLLPKITAAAKGRGKPPGKEGAKGGRTQNRYENLAVSLLEFFLGNGKIYSDMRE